eukprot:CAMPEP_0182424048 /NCGR_PEP_ID=MMETSP1167-20130531/10191_1 /TAXON_ID=2988 /ORGANISM="Mallomonas Sp, Strain CCMP3275" /LENGTH=526 /DNA_ID=CAMNT_0024603551 /DNA_START=58 /DNA_END=1634 /DNA_ORIENTATION=+
MSTKGIDPSSFENEFKKPYFQKLMSTMMLPTVDPEALNKHIEENKDFFRSPAKNGWLPIHYACMAGSFDIVSVLLQAYPESIKLTQHEGLLPLHLAVYGQDPCMNTLELLLTKYPEGALHQSNDGKTPLHLSVDKKAKSTHPVVGILLEHCPSAASLSTNFGKMPLHIACDNDTPDARSIKLLVDTYPEATRHQDDFPYRRLPLHYVLMRNKCKPSLAAVEVLIEVNPDAVSQGEQYGKTPLHVAVGCDSSQVDIQIVKTLLEACPSALRSRCALGRLPIMDLVDRDNPCVEALEILLQASSSVKSTLLLTDRSGNTTLHIATARENPSHQVISLLTSTAPKAASMRNHLDALPLHDSLELAESTSAEALLCLLESYTLAASMTSPKGFLPLHLAAHRSKPCIPLVKRLLEIYPDAASYATQQGGWLPIHCAVGRSTPNKELVQILLDAFPEGAATKCSLGLTPLGCILAQAQPSWDVIVPIIQEAQEKIGKPEKLIYPSETGSGTGGGFESDWLQNISEEDRDKS